MTELNAGSRGQVSKREKKSKLLDLRQKEQFDKTLATYEGRAVLWMILEECGIYKASFRGDTYTEFREGKRAVGLWLLLEIQSVNKTAYMQMQQEATRRLQDGF